MASRKKKAAGTSARELAVAEFEAAEQREAERSARVQQALDDQALQMVERSRLVEWLPNVDWQVVESVPPTWAVVAPPERDFYVQLRAGSGQPEVRVVKQGTREDDGSTFWSGPVVASLAELGRAVRPDAN